MLTTTKSYLVATYVREQACDCGHPSQTVEHYLMNCPRFNHAREDASRELPIVETCMVQKIRYDNEMNKLIGMTVQKFIVATNRFK